MSREHWPEGIGPKTVGFLNEGEYAVSQTLLGEINEQSPQIRAQLISLIEKGFGQIYGDDLTDEDVDQFLGGGDVYLLATPDHTIVGVEIVHMATMEDRKIFFTAATVIHPSHQGKRLHSNFKEFIIERENPDFIAGRTQNPAVYLSYTHGVGTVYPAFGKLIPDDIQELGKKLAFSLSLDNFDPATFIQRKAYGEGVYGQNTYPKINPNTHPDLYHLFSQLHLEEGDAFLILKSLKTRE